jgi:SAM-dependent methyltransferase
MRQNDNPLTPKDMSAIARDLYSGTHGLRKVIQVWRPYICPFDIIIKSVTKGSSVFDIGCGGGLFLGLLAHLDPSITGTGIDASSNAIELARQMALRHPSGARLKFDARDDTDEWPEEHFDIVTMIDVLHHVPPKVQQNVFLAAASRVSPGGRLLFKDMAARPFWNVYANKLHDALLARQWVHHIPIQRVLEWAQEANLTPGAGTPKSIKTFWYAHEYTCFEKSV